MIEISSQAIQRTILRSGLVFTSLEKLDKLEAVTSTPNSLEEKSGKVFQRRKNVFARQKTTMAASEVRQYQYGDDVRAIDWVPFCFKKS